MSLPAAVATGNLRPARNSQLATASEPPNGTKSAKRVGGRSQSVVPIYWSQRQRPAERSLKRKRQKGASEWSTTRPDDRPEADRSPRRRLLKPIKSNVTNKSLPAPCEPISFACLGPRPWCSMSSPAGRCIPFLAPDGSSGPDTQAWHPERLAPSRLKPLMSCEMLRAARCNLSRAGSRPGRGYKSPPAGSGMVSQSDTGVDLCSPNLVPAAPAGIRPDGHH